MEKLKYYVKINKDCIVKYNYSHQVVQFETPGQDKMDDLEYEFGAVDYIVFTSMLLLSLGIGVYFAIKSGAELTIGK